MSYFASLSVPRRGIRSIVLIGMFIWIPCIQAANFAEGSGEANDPYLIATADQLRSISTPIDTNDIRYYHLIADIDLSPQNADGYVYSSPLLCTYKKNSMPITRSLTYPGFYHEGYFKGVFDGNGHTISNLTMFVTESPAGLFGPISSTGVVRNLTLENVMIHSEYTISEYLTPTEAGHCGALSASNAGTIEQCSVSGVIYDFGDAEEKSVGALVGYNAGQIANCRSDCQVYGNLAGGLIGTNSGSVTYCQSQIMILSSEMAGALVGINQGTIWKCLAQGNLEGYRVGGLVGINHNVIYSCFSKCILSGEVKGAIAAENNWYISHCYTKGATDWLVGENKRIVDTCYMQAFPPLPSGYYNLSDHYVNCYFIGTNSDLNLISDIWIPESDTYDPNQFIGFDFYGSDVDGNRDNWFMPKNGLPVLSWQTEITGLKQVPPVSGLSVDQATDVLTRAGFTIRVIECDYYPTTDFSSAFPFETSWLYNRSDQSNREYVRVLFEQTNAILTDESNDIVAYTIPQQVAQPNDIIDVVLTPGEYDFYANPGDGSAGNPYQIETPGQLSALSERRDLWNSHFELNCDLNMADYANTLRTLGVDGFSFEGVFNGQGHFIQGLRSCLFGIIGKDAIVSELTLKHSVVLRQRDEYFPRKWNEPRGGLLAVANKGTITNCSTSGYIQGDMGIGGFVGVNTGSILDCFSDAHIENASQAGGIAGINDASDNSEFTGIVKGCQFSGIIEQGVYYVGGIVGRNTAIVVDCMSDGEITGFSYVGGIVGFNTSLCDSDQLGSVTNCTFSGTVDGMDLFNLIVGYEGISQCTGGGR